LNKLQNLCDKNNITLQDISDNLGVSLDTAKAWSSGRRLPKPIERRQIEMLLGQDAFPDISKYADQCIGCQKTCKQQYWSTIVYCPKYQKDSK
jgi:transcriptional regulator with XRE-family HTH domain